MVLVSHWGLKSGHPMRLCLSFSRILPSRLHRLSLDVSCIPSVYAVLGHHLSQYAPPHHGLCQHTVHPKPQKRSGASSSRKTVILQRNLGIYNSNLNCQFVTGSVCIPSMKVYTSLGARTMPRCFMCPAKLFGSIFLAEICAWLFDAA